MNGTITKNMNGYVCNPEKIIYKVVLTGGPCAGKTTGQSRLCSFFENLGWEVYRVPETASVLLGGGVKFENMNKDQAFFFQESVLKTLIQIEDCFFSLGEMSPKNCLVVCDRGTMDPSAFLHPDEWEKLMQKNNLNPVYLRDTRYHQIIHLMSAAIGAEEFYSTDNNSCRKENVDLARYLDKRAAQAWVGHPYFDVINNSTDFDTKIRRMIDAVCQRIGIDTGDRLNISARKRKFLINDPLPTDSVFPPFEDFNVHHIYLKTNPKGMQIRIRKRGKNGHFSYTHTCRKAEKLGQIVEVKTPIGLKEWNNMQAQADEAHLPIYKKRRCFLYNDQYFQLDIYEEPCHRRCKKLILLETYSTLNPEELENRLPDFLQVVKDVTGEPKYSMFNLSLLSEEDEIESSFEN